MENVREWFMVAVVMVMVAVAFPITASAQVFTPTFMSPESSSDLGVYFSDVGEIGDFATEGIWRRSAGGYDLGIRAGVMDTKEDASLSVGGDIRVPVALVGNPVGFAFTAGAQGIFGGSNRIGAQAGFSTGYTFSITNFTITSYVHPRLAVVGSLDDGNEADGESEDDRETDVRSDVGLNFNFYPNLSVRLVGGVGDGADWGIGVAWRR